MAKGDVAKGQFTLTAASNDVIRPPSGVEWVIHNIYYGIVSGAAPNLDFAIVDGSTVTTFDNDVSRGGKLGHTYHLTNDHYLKISNVSAGTSMSVSYDGIQTK